MTVFVDMDGVLADFDRHHEAVLGRRPDKRADDVDWEKVRAAGDFYLGIPPTTDMRELWDAIAHLEPIVLTGVPSSLWNEASANKRLWVARHLGPSVEVICCLAREKGLHARPGDVLIDDWEKHRALWEARGGLWVTHTSAKTTLARLAELGIISPRQGTEEKTMNWKITKSSEARYVIKDDDGMAKGDITFKGSETWCVEMLMVRDLNFKGSLERCLGYVRGVEKTVSLYGRETKRAQS